MSQQKKSIIATAVFIIVSVLGLLVIPSGAQLFDSGEIGNAFSGYQFTPGYFLSEIPLTDRERLYHAQKPMISFDELFDPYAIHTLIIHIQQDEREELIQEMSEYYETFGNYRVENYKKATMSYTIANHTYETAIGLRTKGDGTRDLPLVDGEIQRVDFSIQLRDGPIGGVDKFLLESNRYDRSQLMQLYSHVILQDIHPLVAHATSTRLLLEIGDQTHDLGVYTLIEPVDEKFVERRGLTGATLYKARAGFLGAATLETPQSPRLIGEENRKSNYRPVYDRKTNKGAQEHTQLLDLIESINTLSGEVFASQIQEALNTDSILQYMAANVILGNPDDLRGMGNNYYLAFSTGQSAMYIPTDLDNGLGEGSMASAGWTTTLDPYQRHRSRLSERGYTPILIDKLLDSKDFRERYVQTIYNLIDTKTISRESFQSFEQMFDKYPSSRWTPERNSNYVYQYFEQRIPFLLRALK